jgi:hypothetical protein
MDATMTDHDQERIDAILAFWFKEQALTAPQIDRRMDVWFGGDEVFDLECKKEFGDDVELASEGKLDHWADEPRGRLALILLLDQIRRNIYRNTARAFEMDKAALKLCVEGARDKKDKRSPVRSRKRRSTSLIDWLRPYHRPTGKRLKLWLSLPSCTAISSSNSGGSRIAMCCLAVKIHPKKTSILPVTAPISVRAAKLR